MNFGDLKELFVEVTGRQDLLIGSGALSIENLVDGGKRLLDDRYGAPDALKTYRANVSPGDYLLDGIELMRVPKSVWATSTSYRSQLGHKELDWMRRYYSAAPSSVAYGMPLFYSLLINLSPQLADLSGATYDDWDAIVNNPEGKFGLIFMPPADQVMTITINGLFYSKRLTEDEDVNFWSECYPHELVKAASLYHEMLYTSGVRIPVGITILDEMLRGFVYNQNDFNANDIRLRG